MKNLYFSWYSKNGHKWQFFVHTGQILFLIPSFTLYFDIREKHQKNAGGFFLGDLSWNRPILDYCFKDEALKDKQQYGREHEAQWSCRSKGRLYIEQKCYTIELELVASFQLQMCSQYHVWVQDDVDSTFVFPFLLKKTLKYFIHFLSN